MNKAYPLELVEENDEICKGNRPHRQVAMIFVKRKFGNK